MTASSVEGFFDNSVRSSAPSIKLSQPNDGVIGEIVDQFKVEKKEFGKDVVERDRNGNPIFQLVVILQTELRNWQRVAKIPLVDPTDKSKGEKAATEDDGKRAVYIAPFTNLHAAIGRATAVNNGGRPTDLRNGSRLGVKVLRLEDTGKGNPKKVYEAVYEPATQSAGFFEAQSQPAAQDPRTGKPSEPAAPTEQQEAEPPF